jgi:hypothetical protein
LSNKTKVLQYLLNFNSSNQTPPYMFFVLIKPNQIRQPPKVALPCSPHRLLRSSSNHIRRHIRRPSVMRPAAHGDFHHVHHTTTANMLPDRPTNPNFLQTGYQTGQCNPNLLIPSSTMIFSHCNAHELLVFPAIIVGFNSSCFPLR